MSTEITPNTDEMPVVAQNATTPMEKIESALTNAVCDVMGKVRRLKKAHDNAFAKYKYTSVDDFKDQLRPLLAASGLRINMSEDSCDFIEVPKTEKKPQSTAVKFTFVCQLLHDSGEVAEPEYISVILPFVGAQTTGQARSYALKEYLKSEFFASSGDSEDADESADNEELSRAEAKDLYVELQSELDQVANEGVAQLEAWVSRRRPSLAVLPKDWKTHMRRRFQEALATGKVSEAGPLQEDEDMNAEYKGIMGDDNA